MAPLKVSTSTNYEIDPLELELTMEKIRQTASKITWEGLAGALRRNMMDKRSNLDINDRLDIQRALAIFRKSLPIEETSDLSIKLRQLADGLECQFLVEPGLVFIKNADVAIEITVEASEVKSAKIAYFQAAPLYFAEFRELVAKNEWEKVRNGVHSVLASISSFHAQERSEVAHALSVFETWIASQGLAKQGCDPTSFNKLPLGALLPRSPLRPARLLFAADPTYAQKFEQPEFDLEKNSESLPYFEILVTPCDQETNLPFGVAGTEWTTQKTMKACFTLKFSSPFIFSADVWRSLQRFLAKPSSIREHVNLYRYLSGYDMKKNEFLLRASLNGEQFYYFEISNTELYDESDVIVNELHLIDGRDLKKVLNLVRTQFSHNTFYKSLLAWTIGHKRKTTYSLLRIQTSLSTKCFEFTFGTGLNLSIVRIFENNGEWIVQSEGTDGHSDDDLLDKRATALFEKCWSLPILLRHIIQARDIKFEAINSNKRLDDDEAMDTDIKENDLLQSDKVASSWLQCSHHHQKKRKREQFDFTIEDPLMTDGTEPAGLLELWKERDERPVELIPPQEPCRSARRGGRDLALDALASSRTAHRLVSDTTLQNNAVSDLDEIARLAQNLDEDYTRVGVSTPTSAYPYFGGSGVSPRGYHSHSYMNMPGGGQLSPLENARQKMNAVVTGNEMYDFPDETSSQGSFPSPHYGSTGFNTPSYMSASASPLGASFRGQPTKRRGRGRRSGNVGDREGSVESPGPPTARKTRGSSTGQRRGGRGVRKSVGPEHTVFDQRPPLMRTFSDAPYSNEPPTPFSTGSSSHSPFVEESDSDEETDPPKYIPGASHAQHHQQQLSSSSIITATVAPSPAALAAQSVVVPPVSQPLNSNFGSVSPKSRKLSMDLISGKPSPSISSTLTPTTTASPFPSLSSMPPAPKPKAFSDLYDDGIDSPPPPLSANEGSSDGQATPTQPPHIQPSPSVTISPIERKPSILQSPVRAFNSFEAALAMGDMPTSKESSSTRDGKLIIKIPKDPKTTRGSPSVESMKSKSLKLISMTDKSEKKEREKEKDSREKEREKEKKGRRESIDKDPNEKKDLVAGIKTTKTISDEKRKRKLEREREETRREHKKNKLEKPDKERDKEKKDSSIVPTPPLPFMQSLSSFKIPKKTTTEPEKESPNPPTLSSATVSGFSARDSSQRDSREQRDPRERDRERPKEKSGPPKLPPMRPHPGMAGMPPMSRVPPSRTADPSLIPLPPAGPSSGNYFNRKPLVDPQRKPSGPHLGQRPTPASQPGQQPYRWAPPIDRDRTGAVVPISALPTPASPSPEPIADPDSPDALKIVDD
ncbi:unnamed protein product, partial [Mesorhabditis belari]|uniref:Mediator complex subunit 1 n=1 Tax=Mesorhabditis belari TaxID=2138241 RepID=A0AAF3EAL7_9BILA